MAPSRHQVKVLHNCLYEKAISELMPLTGRSDRTKFRNQVLKPLLESRLAGNDSPRQTQEQQAEVPIDDERQGSAGESPHGTGVIQA